ncbi:hypothetical protein FHS51_001070 [Sphingobium wenxiniae]|uniref:Uncharacterized protein n=2 Tax=Sphingomonadaceae TaxID=41297 RepID=A0A246JFT7_9SPHN|nr:MULTISPECIES: hypothetical protein [Sphingomonadaceae]MBB6190850.1 hypothetical protein [Sphingobium wenxiniae]OWQ91117.1 hypothetical protein CDQ91_19460 [Sphingopyxis witflariensis]TWH93840.1 hypothetical protein IQ35_02050 [Sphingobium wenxiniae]UNK78079.1 hypothetical protein MNQ96_10820 [Sphingopyxis granuli]
MLFSNPVARLRKAHYALEGLPDTITFPQHPACESEDLLPLVDATIDDVAFAIVAADQEYSAAYRRASALRRLYQMAREAGATGVDPAVKSALKRSAS